VSAEANDGLARRSSMDLSAWKGIGDLQNYAAIPAEERPVKMNLKVFFCIHRCPHVHEGQNGHRGKSNSATETIQHYISQRYGDVTMHKCVICTDPAMKRRGDIK
jgi:hypothetical protein